jgi:hypothetical protein
MTQQPQQLSGFTQPVQQTSTLAIVSLITGIATWIFLPIIGALIAVITGHMAKTQIRASAGRLTGSGLATAGLVLGYMQIILVVVPVCTIIILALLGPAIGNVFSGIVEGI